MMNPVGWFRRRRLDELADEIQAHIDEKTDALVATGMPRTKLSARRGARSATSPG